MISETCLCIYRVMVGDFLNILTKHERNTSPYSFLAIKDRKFTEKTYQFIDNN